MKILNRYTGETIFYFKCRTKKECLEEAARQKINLRDADLRVANLRCADLHDVNLQCADLRGADLQGTNLRGEKLTKNPVYINAGLRWEVWITDKRIKIGCQLHSTKAWEKFTDKQISKMSDNALDFWKVWKKPILEMAKAHQGG